MGSKGKSMLASEKAFDHKIGDEVLVRWKDMRVYYANIRKIDRGRKRCVIQFEDHGQRGTVKFDQIHSVDAPIPDDIWLACVICKFGHSNRPNEIVLCDKCSVGYHQQCHEPNIAEQAATDQNFPWTCVYCEQDKENPHLKLDAEDQAATNEDVQHSQEVHNDNEVGKDEDGCDDEMESKLQKDVAKVEASNGKRGDKLQSSSRRASTESADQCTGEPSTGQSTPDDENGDHRVQQRTTKARKPAAADNTMPVSSREASPPLSARTAELQQAMHGEDSQHAVPVALPKPKPLRPADLKAMVQNSAKSAQLPLFFPQESSHALLPKATTGLASPSSTVARVNIPPGRAYHGRSGPRGVGKAKKKQQRPQDTEAAHKLLTELGKQADPATLASFLSSQHRISAPYRRIAPKGGTPFGGSPVDPPLQPTLSAKVTSTVLAPSSTAQPKLSNTEQVHSIRIRPEKGTGFKLLPSRANTSAGNSTTAGNQRSPLPISPSRPGIQESCGDRTEARPQQAVEKGKVRTLSAAPTASFHSADARDQARMVTYSGSHGSDIQQAGRRNDAPCIQYELPSNVKTRQLYPEAAAAAAASQQQRPRKGLGSPVFAHSASLPKRVSVLSRKMKAATQSVFSRALHGRKPPTVVPREASSNDQRFDNGFSIPPPPVLCRSGIFDQSVSVQDLDNVFNGQFASFVDGMSSSVRSTMLGQHLNAVRVIVPPVCLTTANVDGGSPVSLPDSGDGHSAELQNVLPQLQAPSLVQCSLDGGVDMNTDEQRANTDLAIAATPQPQPPQHRTGFRSPPDSHVIRSPRQFAPQQPLRQPPREPVEMEIDYGHRRRTHQPAQSKQMQQGVNGFGNPGHDHLRTMQTTQPRQQEGTQQTKKRMPSKQLRYQQASRSSQVHPLQGQILNGRQQLPSKGPQLYQQRQHQQHQQQGQQQQQLQQQHQRQQQQLQQQQQQQQRRSIQQPNELGHTSQSKPIQSSPSDSTIVSRSQHPKCATTANRPGNGQSSNAAMPARSSPHQQLQQQQKQQQKPPGSSPQLLAKVVNGHTGTSATTAAANRPMCIGCKRPASSICSVCRKVWYCSTTCQAKYYKLACAKCLHEPKAPKAQSTVQKP